jgi:hypothetical protein
MRRMIFGLFAAIIMCGPSFAGTVSDWDWVVSSRGMAPRYLNGDTVLSCILYTADSITGEVTTPSGLWTRQRSDYATIEVWASCDSAPEIALWGVNDDSMAVEYVARESMTARNALARNAAKGCSKEWIWRKTVMSLSDMHRLRIYSPTTKQVWGIGARQRGVDHR